MNKFLKLLILSIPLLMVSGYSIADACDEAVKGAPVVTTLTPECQKQILGFDATLENINKVFQAENSPSALDVAKGKIKGNSETNDSSTMMMYGIAYISLTCLSFIACLFLVGIIYNIMDARKINGSRSVLAKEAATANFIKMAMKIPFFVSWTGIIVFCFLVSMVGSAVLIYNIMINNNVKTQLSYASYAAETKSAAKERAENDIKGLLKYYSCVIDHDKTVIFDNAVNADYTLKDSDYLNCMTGPAPALTEPRTSFISRHLYKVQDCGLKYANLSTANCGFVDFKIDAQQILKEKFISFENKLLTAANDVRSYYCLNQPIVEKDSEIKNACWAYNPVTSQIPLDGNGRVSYVTTSKSFDELKATEQGLIQEWISALEATAQENFKTYVPIKREFTLPNYIRSKFIENDLIRAVRNFNKQAMDYDFSYVDEFQYRQIKTSYSSMNNFIDGGTKTTSVHNKQIESIIDSLTEKTDDEVIRDLMFSMADFLGRGFIESLGGKYEEGGDYNVISATIQSGQKTATYLIITSIALEGVKGGISMLGTRSMSGKPDMKMVLLEKTMGFFAGYTKAFGIAIAGATIGLVLLIFGTMVSQVTSTLENIVKIAYLYELYFVMAGIDDKSGKMFNNDDIARRLITMLYVVLIFPALVIEFELVFQVSYLLVDFAKDNFYIINKSAGYVVESGNTIMSIIYGFMITFALHVIVISTMMLGMKTVNQKFHAAFIMKMFGSQDLKTGMLFEDQDKFASNTEGHFGSMAKNARNQRI